MGLTASTPTTASGTRFQETSRRFVKSLAGQGGAPDGQIEVWLREACEATGIDPSDYSEASEIDATQLRRFQMQLMVQATTPPEATVSQGAFPDLVFPKDGVIYYFLGATRCVHEQFLNGKRALSAALRDEGLPDALVAGAHYYLGQCLEAEGFRNAAEESYRHSRALAERAKNAAGVAACDSALGRMKS